MIRRTATRSRLRRSNIYLSLHARLYEELHHSPDKQERKRVASEVVRQCGAP